MSKSGALLLSLSLALFFTVFPRPLFPETPATSLYDILRVGDLEELRAECRRRGLPEDGDVGALRRRLLDDERARDSTPFESRLESSGEGDIVLRHADFIEYGRDEKGNGIVWLRGNVKLAYAGKEIKADEVNLNIDAKLVVGKGSIVFTDRNRQYFAESFFYDANTDEGVFIDARTTLGKMFYHGESLGKIPEGQKFRGSELSLTTCGIGNPHYRIEADRLYLYDGERALVENATFYYGSQPVLRLPYLYRKVDERAVKTAVLLRERSGLVVQNTFRPLNTDAKQLALKGDFYERLGIYAGVDYRTLSERGETSVGASAALSNDVYYYDSVRGNWSPLGPPSASDKEIDRSVRYKAGFSQSLRFGTAYDNTFRVNLLWISDPYYEYDFERRAEWFDIFALLGQAAYDDPREGEGFEWLLDDAFSKDNLKLSLSNRVRFEPQRNSEEDIPSLPDYYQYEIYTLAAPDITVTHSDRILKGSGSAVFGDVDYASGGRYRYTAYFDENGSLSSQVHNAQASVRFAKNYALTGFLAFTPSVEAGAEGQTHVDPNSDELTDDRESTLLYGRTRDQITVGVPSVYFALTYDLKYKLAGPDDLYEFGRFKVNELGMKGYAGTGFISDTVTTSYDLRPVYDWDAGEYVGSIFGKERFYPLVNTLTIKPFPSLSVNDKLVIDIASGVFKTNGFGLSYASEAVYLKRVELKATGNIIWEHSFVDPYLDVFNSSFGVEVRPHPLWVFNVGVISKNDEFWRYFSKTAGDGKENLFLDLLKSFNFFNRQDREESGFKLKSVSVGFGHDLHDWLLRGGYTGIRELSYDRTRYQWNNTFYISLSLKDIKNFDIHTEYTKRR